MRNRYLPLLIAVAAAAFVPDARADQTFEQKLMQKLESMEAELKTLRGQVRELEAEKNKPAPAPVAAAPITSAPIAKQMEKSPLPSDLKAQTQTASTEPTAPLTNLNGDLDPGQFGLTYRTTEALRFGAYGEIKFGGQQTDEGWSNGFDASRAVLLGTYGINDWITFNTELEFEHGGIARDADDKLSGSVDVEQIFVDFKFNDYFNWRAPGVDVVPVGYVGLFHEPTQFYSVNRPELYNGLIPSTWFEGASSFYGKVVDNLTYQVQVSTGLEDAGAIGDESDSSVPADGYEPGISGTEALGLSRASIGDRKQLGNNLGYAARLAYTPPFVPGLAGSSSVYHTSNTSPRGAFGNAEDGSTVPLGKSSLTMVDTELRYRIPTTGLELRGEYAQIFFGDTKYLRANNDGDSENNVGDSMYGYSFEAAYHVELANVMKNGWEVVPFYRFTQQNLQTGGEHGLDLDEPTGAGKQSFHSFGVAVFPTPKLVLKMDYQIASDDAPDSPSANHFFGAVGFFF